MLLIGGELMDIKQLECFIHLAENLSFSATAQIMYQSQPAVSSQIKSLETELGVNLFQRTKRRVYLTSAGESFYHDIKEILELLNQAKIKAKYNERKYLSKYTITYEENFLAVKFLSKLVFEFKKIHPEIFLELKVTSFKRKNQLYLENKSDFMFTVYEGIENLPDLIFEQLYVGHYVCVMPKSHELSMHKSIPLKELSEHNLVLLNPINAPEEMKRMFKKIENNVSISSKIYCDSVFSGYTLVKGGLGIAVMPDFVCLEDREVVVVPISMDEYISYGIAWNKKNTSKAIDDFIKTAKNIYSNN